MSRPAKKRRESERAVMAFSETLICCAVRGYDPARGRSRDV
jgi:hypothetical protein